MDFDRCLNQLKHDDYLAVGGSRQRILNSRSYSPSKIFCFDQKESIAVYQQALFVRKDFALRRKVDKIIRRAFEGGLVLKWDRDSQRKKEHIIPYVPPPQFTLEEYAVAFVFIIGVGSFMSTSAFVCEIIINRKMNQMNRSRYWKYLEHFFDGKRHYLKNITDRLRRNKVRKVQKIVHVCRKRGKHKRDKHCCVLQ